MLRRTTALLILSIALPGCGSHSPAGPSAPPTPLGTSVTFIVFYDENANSVADPGEVVRVPGVEVALGGRTARSETLSGRAVVTIPAVACVGTAARGIGCVKCCSRTATQAGWR